MHQGPGLTNALTGITEAAKSRTPLVVLAADVAGAAVRSNFRIDTGAIAAAVGAVPERLHSPQSAVADAVRAYRTAARQRRTVLLAMPLDVQAAQCDPGTVPAEPAPSPPAPAPEAAAALAAALAAASRPVFVAGRGARVAAARQDLEELAGACGALLATSAAAKGLFRGSPWDLDVSGGFASPLAAELIGGADLLVGWGCSLNMWTMRHGALIGPGCVVVQVDDDDAAIGAHRPVQLGILGDVAETARAVTAALRGLPPDSGPGGRLPVAGDPAADRRRGPLARRSLRGRERRGPDRPEDAVHRAGRPAASRPRGRRGLRQLHGLPEHVPVRPGRAGLLLHPGLPVGGPGPGLGHRGRAGAPGPADRRRARRRRGADGISELETVVRLGLPMVIVVYDDEAYGAEVHHFRPNGHRLDTVTFPPADIAQIGRGFGCDGVTVRGRDDLAQVSRWLDGPRDRPLVVDAKVTSRRGSWWLEEAFRGH